MEKNLEECIEGCRQGDPKAQSELYIRYASWMKQRVLPLVGDESLAEDLVHDTFILILEHIGELKDSSRLEPWMSLTLRRVALQYLRGWYARHISFPGVLPEKRKVAPDCISSITMEELYHLSDRLPEGYRKVFRLAYFEEMSHGEIARILGIRPHSSSSQLARARALFRKLLKEYGFGASVLLLWLWMSQNQEPYSVSEIESSPFRKSSDALLPDIRSAKPSSFPKMYGHSLNTGFSSDSLSYTDTVCVDSLDRAEKEELPEDESPKENKILDLYRYRLPNERLPMAKSWKKRIQRKGRWVLSLAYSQNRGMEAIGPKAMPIMTRTVGSGGDVFVPGTTTSWDEYYEYLTTFFPSFDEPQKVLNLIDIARQNQGQQIKETAHYDQPFVFKFLVSRQWNERWLLDLGLQYKKLGAQFKIGSDSLLVTRQTIHYVGLSSGVGWKWWQGRHFNLQATMGVSLDVPVNWSSRTDYVFEGRAFYSESNAIRPRPQWSVFGGVGIEVPLHAHFSLFLGPQLNYYFPVEGPVKTIHTDRPFEFTVPVGLRWNY